MAAITTPTMIAGTRVYTDFCVSFEASAGVACVFVLAVCASMVSLRAPPTPFKPGPLLGGKSLHGIRLGSRFARAQ